MRVAAHQPCFLPRLHLVQRWLGVDQLVWLEGVQFARKSPDEHGRNQPTGQASTPIRTPDGIGRLVVPVTSGRQTIDETPLALDRWPQHLMATIESNYRRAARYDELAPSLDELLAQAVAEPRRAQRGDVRLGPRRARCPRAGGHQRPQPRCRRRRASARLMAVCEAVGAPTCTSPGVRRSPPTSTSRRSTTASPSRRRRGDVRRTASGSDDRSTPTCRSSTSSSTSLRQPARAVLGT